MLFNNQLRFTKNILHVSLVNTNKKFTVLLLLKWKRPHFVIFLKANVSYWRLKISVFLVKCKTGTKLWRVYPTCRVA